MGAERWIDDQLAKLIEQIDVVNDTDAANVVLHGFARSCGFQRFAYICADGDELVGLTDYPPDWREVYVERNFKAVDPVMRMARQSLNPFAWGGNNERLNGLGEADFFREAERHGICSGFSMPIPAGYGRLAMLSLASADPEASAGVAVHNPVLAATAVAFVHLGLLRSAKNSSNRDRPRLTGREAICLMWSSRGKTAAEIATVVGISEITVRFHLNQARDRLGAGNVSHAIRLAVERGLI
ncbi:autoinducer binding domain-containing protein [Aquamicrobium sp. NLF2-7]|uniref:autoinducer binding domain-containing protein n=1 Tax=Aquamicrobium sp. NLF2-7 TaxID=2918753 RepID=UPI001EFAEA02|nr:autoinducer binding domain-containing protein [Aquamicrobium sp. NLF2-7]MCG8273945.1 autoinducer binding domain-containing protein [Aquamicrobium sp. NLF2-7]